MKKLIGTVVLAAMVAGAAFADISFGSWGRGLWVVGNAKNADGDGNTVSSTLTQSWGGAGPRTGLVVRGDSDNIGFCFEIHNNGFESAIPDGNAYIYVTPAEWIKFTIAGTLDTGTMRSDAAFGSWNWHRLGYGGSPITANPDGKDIGRPEGFIFPELFDGAGVVEVQITPIEGLMIVGGYAPGIGDLSSERFPDQLGPTGAFAVGYTIENVGTIKVGVAGRGKSWVNWDDSVHDYTNKDGDEVKDRIDIDAAFELNAVEGLYIGLGGQVPIIGTYSDGAKKAPAFVNLYARIGMVENLAIHVIAGFKISAADAKEAKADGAFGFMAGAGVEYSFDNGIGIWADLYYGNGIWCANDSSDNKDHLQFGLGVQKGFSNGVAGIAFQGGTNNLTGNLANADDFQWGIPVKFEYWF